MTAPPPRSDFHARLFGRLAPLYARWWKPVVLRALSGGGFDEEMAGLLALYRPGPNERILDVGCGPGNVTAALASLATSGLVVGMDLARPMLQEGRRTLLESAFSNVRFVQADAEVLPVRRGSVSLVSCCGVLHLLPNPAAALREIAAVLRPGGVFIGMTLVRPDPGAQRLVSELFSATLRFRFFNMELLRELFSQAGLSITAHVRSQSMMLFRAEKFGIRAEEPIHQP